MVPPNSTPPREGSVNSAISQEGSNSPSSNSGNNGSQAGNNSVSSQAGRQTGNPLPHWEASQATRAARVVARSLQTGRQAPPFPGTAQFPRKPVQFPLTALLPGKAALTVLSPRKEAIPPLLTQVILGLRQVTVQLLPRQLGTQPGLGLPRQAVLFTRWIARSPRQARLHPLIAPLHRQIVMQVPGNMAYSPH